MKLELALKDNEIRRRTNVELYLKKEIEKEQHISSDLHTQMDGLEKSISSLQKDIKELQDVNNEQKASLSDICLLHILLDTRNYTTFTEK